MGGPLGGPYGAMEATLQGRIAGSYWRALWESSMEGHVWEGSMGGPYWRSLVECPMENHEILQDAQPGPYNGLNLYTENVQWNRPPRTSSWSSPLIGLCGEWRVESGEWRVKS